jgi:hypothetical protein
MFYKYITNMIKFLKLYFGRYIVLQRSRDSDWLRAGRPRGRSSSPGRVKNFLFSTSSRRALGSTQPPIQWVPGAILSGVKRSGREADHSLPVSAEVKKIWIYIFTHSAIRLYGVMLNCLSTGTTLLLSSQSSKIKKYFLHQ